MRQALPAGAIIAVLSDFKDLRRLSHCTRQAGHRLPIKRCRYVLYLRVLTISTLSSMRPKIARPKGAVVAPSAPLPETDGLSRSDEDCKFGCIDH
jgi:hypothetical protein